MAGDGSIIIDTRIDTDGVDRGLENIKKAIESKMGDAEEAAKGVMDSISSIIGDTKAVRGGEKLISALADILRGGGGTLSSAALSSVNSAGEAVKSGSGAFASGGLSLIAATAGGLLSGKGQVISAAAEAAAEGAAGAGESSGRFYSVGSNLINALRNGISAGASALYAKAAAIASSVIAKFKGIFGIHSPSRVFRDEIGRMLMLGLSEGIMSNSQVVLEALEDLTADMLASEKKYLEEKERLDKEYDELDEAERAMEYQKRLEEAQSREEKEQIIEKERLRLKKRADQEYLDQLKDSAEKERQIVDQLKEDITATYKDIAQYTRETLGEVSDNRDKLEEKLKSFGEESDGYVKLSVETEENERTLIGARKTKTETQDYYYLADQQKSIEMLERYAAALSGVRERLENEFSPETAHEFMQTLAEMEVEDAVIFSETLFSASAEEFKAYMEKWSEKNSLAETIASQFYGSDFAEAVDDCTQYMKRELEAVGLEIPEGFFASGSLSAEQFGKGFKEGIDKVLEETRQIIVSFGDYSAGAAGSVVNNTNYYSSYSINGTKSTAAESIYAAQAASLLNKYRGIEE